MSSIKPYNYFNLCLNKLGTLKRFQSTRKKSDFFSLPVFVKGQQDSPESTGYLDKH